MSIKSSKSLVEEALKKIQTLNPNEVKELLEKKRNYLNRCKRYKRTVERRYNRKFKTYTKRHARVLVGSRKHILSS